MSLFNPSAQNHIDNMSLNETIEALLERTTLPKELVLMILKYFTITKYDVLKRVVESRNGGKCYFTPSLKEYERCMRKGSDIRNLLRTEGFAFHVTFPEGLQQVGECAFSGCSSLKTVALPEGLQQVGRFAFYECSSLKTVTFPEGLQQVGGFAFAGCSSLKTVTLPQGCFYTESSSDPSFPYGCSVQYRRSRPAPQSDGGATEAAETKRCHEEINIMGQRRGLKKSAQTMGKLRFRLHY